MQYWTLRPLQSDDGSPPAAISTRMSDVFHDKSSDEGIDFCQSQSISEPSHGVDTSLIWAARSPKVVVEGIPGEDRGFERIYHAERINRHLEYELATK
jgi:hypothetical protein